jgi:hypothetical protein
VFHIELRQFPYTARAFNLAEEELRAQLLLPWVAGRPVQWAERRWAPDRATLTILSGPELGTEELGMGRGWPNAVRASENVTDELLAQARRIVSATGPRARLKQELRRRCEAGPLPLTEAVRQAGALWPLVRASERLSLTEQAVWELLHEGQSRLLSRCAEGREQPVPAEQWQPLLLRWETWTGQEPPALLLDAVTPAGG